MTEGQAKSSAGDKAESNSFAEWMSRPQAPVVLLAAVSVIAAGWFLVLTSGEYFFSDEWSRFSFFPNVDFEWTLHGTSGHLIFLNALLYRGLLEVFGGDSYLPFRLTCLALQLAAVWLLYFYLRPRVNAWLVVGCATPLLFLGSAWVVTASAYGIVILTPIVLGLGALLALDSRGRYTDAAASILLVLAVLSHSGALPFLAGAAVLVAASDRRWLVRLWVIAPGVAVYLAWFVWARYLSADLIFFEEPLSIANVSFLPESLVQIPSAALAAATGTFYRLDAVGALDFNIGPGYVLLALALAGCFVLWRKSGVGVFQRALVPASMLLVFAFLVAFGMSDPARQPTSPRYIYFTVLCVLWIFCELAPAIRWRPWGYGALVAVLGVGLLANANIYGKAASSLRDAGARSRAAITALEIAGPAATPWLRISDVVQGAGADGAFSEWIVRLDQESIARFGVASYSPVELRTAGPQTQATTDRILLGVERIRLRSLDSPLATPKCSAPAIISSAPLLERVEVRPGESLSIDAGRATGHSVTVGVSRFGGSPITLGDVSAGAVKRIAFPADRSKQPWQVALSPGGRARLCLIE